MFTQIYHIQKNDSLHQQIKHPKVTLVINIWEISDMYKLSWEKHRIFMWNEVCTIGYTHEIVEFRWISEEQKDLFVFLHKGAQHTDDGITENWIDNIPRTNYIWKKLKTIILRRMQIIYLPVILCLEKAELLLDPVTWLGNCEFKWLSWLMRTLKNIFKKHKKLGKTSEDDRLKMLESHCWQ